MKKRIVSLLMAVLMLVTMLPVQAVAAELTASGSQEQQAEPITAFETEVDFVDNAQEPAEEEPVSDEPENARPAEDEAPADAVVQAAEEESDFNYTVNNGAATVTKYNGTGGDVEIPATLGNVPVTTIGSSAFSGCTSLTSVAFPASVTKIDSYAFWNCSNLGSVTLPERLEELNGCAFGGTALTNITIPAALKTVDTAYADGTYGHGPFYKCEKLETVTFEEGMTAIPWYLMRDCAGLKTINWASSITSIGTYAFNYCTGLEELVIPGEITAIGDNAFGYCSGLKNVTLQEGTTTIGRYAFEVCTGLTDMTFPASVTKIDSYAFWNCSNLGSVTLPERLEELNGCAFGGTVLTGITIPATLKTVDTAYADGTYNHGPFYKCETLETVTFEEGMTAIPGYLMRDCAGLKTINWASSITSIGTYAFNYCTGLEELVIPGEIAAIGDNAFGYCSGLKNVTLQEGTTTIGRYAFSGCTGLTGMTFPASVTKIDSYAFWNCSNLGSVTLPEKLEELNGCAFGGTALTNITIPATLKTVDTAYADGTYNHGPFYKCETLETVTFEEGMTAIPGYLMKDCAGLKTITWASSITSIGTYAFNYCTGLEELVIPGEITAIGDNAFSYCSGLKNVTLQEGTTTIGRYAFSGCTGLTGMTFPASVTKIDSYAFWNCSNLGSVTLPEKLEELNGCAFGGTALTNITIPATLKTVDTAYADGTYNHGPFYKCETLEAVTFEEGMTAIPGYLMKDCAGLKTITWASSITSIGTYAFNYCTGLEALVIPGEITAIGDNAFSYCSGLKNVTLQEGTTTIGRYAFSGCTGLTGMTFPASVTKIDSYAFWNCSNLGSVTLPEKLEELNGCAFGGTALTSITIPATLKMVDTAYADGTYGHGPFYKCEKLEAVTFEEGMTAIPGYLMRDCAGLKTINWASSITSIGTYAFNYCTGLEELVIPGEITAIGDNAFSYCSGLKNVTLQEGTTTIGRYAFSGCTGLTGMTFPASVTKIDSYAFWNCSNLGSVTLPEKLEELNGCAFGGTALTNITIPATLKTVDTAYADGTYGHGPFYKCEKLETVTFEEGMTAIPGYLMRDCAGLTYAFIPDSVTSVGESAFANCPNVVLYTKLNSAATIYAIENGLLFVATDGGTATSSKVLDRTKSRFYADINSIQSNGYMTVTVTVSVPEDTWATLSNQRVKIRIPAQTELEQSSLKVNDVLCQDFEQTDESGKVVVIPLTERESTIRFYVRLTGQGDMAGYAALLYQEKDRSDMEIVGILNEKVVSLSITGPERTGKNTVMVEGIAPANGAVTIQLDGQTVDTVTANKAGAYQCTVTLPNQTETAYTITASCAGADEETLTASHVVYYQAAMPVLTKFTLFVEGHGMQEVDLLKYHSQNIRPSVGYYLTLPPYRFEVAFENGESLRSVYVTSTKNNVKKVMEAKYDSETGCYVAEGYFDDDNHAYVPGNLSVEYNLPSQAIYVGDPVDWEKVGSQSDAALKNAKVNNTVTSAGNSGTIDLSDVDEELQDVVLDYVVENHDNMTTSDAAKLSELVDLAKTAKNVYSYIIPGADDEKYILALDMRDPKSYVMIVADGMEAGSAITKFRLSMAKSIDNPNYAKLFDLADTLEDMSQAATLIYKIYNIYDDHDKLCNDIAQSNTIVDKTEAMQRANELKDDRLCFTLMTTMLPLIVAGGVMTGPAILFTAMVGGMVALSNIFWQLRVSQIKGENYGINWYIDPSGVVTDAATGKPLAGVTATAYWVPAAEDTDLMDQRPADNEYGTQWEGADYSKENPQQTDGNGWYQWDVPEGWWRVRYEKPGYEPAWSEWMPVPPPQMEVNIALERVYAWGDVNGDKQITITDVACLYHYLTTGEYQGGISGDREDYQECLKLALDINGDDAVDVYDIQWLYECVSLGEKLKV